MDLLFKRPGGRPAIAVEIDRGNKQWSLTKLGAEVDAGNIALWVRWKGDTIIPVPASIGLVDIRATRITAE